MITNIPRKLTMLEHSTLDQLHALKLHGFAHALEEQMRQPNIHAMSFEERLALLVDREVNLRSERKQTRLLQLAEQLRVLHGSGGFGKWLVHLAKTDVVILDDWGVASLDPSTRSDLLENIDDRAAHRATVITTQLPVDHWHAWIGDATIADAILDRVLQQLHRVELAGESLRRPAASANAKKAPTKDRGATSEN